MKKQFLHVLSIQHFCLSLHAVLIINHVCDRFMFNHYWFNRLENWSFQYNVYSGIELITITPSTFEESFSNTCLVKSLQQIPRRSVHFPCTSLWRRTNRGNLSFVVLWSRKGVFTTTELFSSYSKEPSLIIFRGNS